MGKLDLLQQFAIAAALVLGATMLFLGSWVSHRVTAGVLTRTAEVGALYMESALEPLVQNLADGGSLSADAVARLEAVTASYTLRRHVLSIKIWRPDGTIAFSSVKGLAGQRFDTAEIEPALNGEVKGYLGELDDDENAFERTLGAPLYEIYGPIYATGSRTVIAVGEFYEDATRLESEIGSTVADSWKVIGGASFAMLLGLCGIVYRGSRTIERQRIALKRKYREQMQLNATNEHLQARIQEALRRTSRVDQKLHRRIGAELHDGPAQLLAYALLRLEAVEEAVRKSASAQTPDLMVLAKVRGACADAMKEIRAISTGLLLPLSENTTDIADAVGRVIIAHELRTGCEVGYRRDVEAPVLDPDIVGCLARITQEALNNAHRHAPNASVTVELTHRNGWLRLEIADDGPGLPALPPEEMGHRARLGVVGMTYRAEALGGSLAVRNRNARGVSVVCELPLGDDGFASAKAGASTVKNPDAAGSSC